MGKKRIKSSSAATKIQRRELVHLEGAFLWETTFSTSFYNTTVWFPALFTPTYTLPDISAISVTFYLWERISRGGLTCETLRSSALFVFQFRLACQVERYLDVLCIVNSEDVETLTPGNNESESVYSPLVMKVRVFNVKMIQIHFKESENITNV